jgi:hypothetical protein
LLEAMAPNESLPDSLQYTIGSVTDLVSTCTRSFPFKCCASDGRHCTHCVRVLQWKTAWTKVQQEKQLCLCPAHRSVPAQGVSRLLQRLQRWPKQVYQHECLVQLRGGQKRYIDLYLPGMKPTRAIEVNGSDHDGHRHSKNNSAERLERQKVETCLKLGMVCAVVYNTHTDEDWDATLEVMMTPGQIGLHSTCPAFLERYWRHGRV